VDRAGDLIGSAQRLTGSQSLSARRILDWTRAQLARASGVSYVLLTQLENGSSPALTARSDEMLRALLWEVGIDVGDSASGVRLADAARLPVSPGQCRTARRLLGLGERDLAREATVAPWIVFEFERGRHRTVGPEVSALKRALESLGAEFVPGPDGIVTRVRPGSAPGALRA
jgi:predicted transcriptional regulator